jgi:SAM-dependent methyltransferase
MNEMERVVAVAGAERPKVSLEEYYTEAGADYAAWSPEFNMHFGYFRWGMNPFDRERMLEQMNVEVLRRLRLNETVPARVLDMGCGLGATLRSFARKLPGAELTGITRVPWQVEQATQLNGRAGCGRIRIVDGNYERTTFATGSMDAVHALESSCYAHGADKRQLLMEARRLLHPGGRLVVADGFLERAGGLHGPQRAIFKKLCECWVIDTWGEIDAFVGELERLGFEEIEVECLQYRVAPSTFHIPWVTAKFLLSEVVFGEGKMTRARWNNVIAPALLPLVSMPLGPMVYWMVSATRGRG